jgi:hypothetical protein
MKKVNVIDQHPGKWQDGIELVLCSIAQSSESGALGKGNSALTGFSASVLKQIGMFNKDEQPIQVILKDGEKYLFTMSNIGIVTTQDVNRLMRDGTIVIGDIDDIYPVYQIMII